MFGCLKSWNFDNIESDKMMFFIIGSIKSYFILLMVLKIAVFSVRNITRSENNFIFKSRIWSKEKQYLRETHTHM